MTRNWTAVMALVLGASWVTAGCGQKQQQPDQPARRVTGSTEKRDVLGEFVARPPPQQPTGATQGGSAAALPPGHPPTGNVDSASDSAAAVPLKFTAPPTWKLQAVKSRFRKAQYVIPRSQGDPDDGLFILYYFGKGEGGTAKLNIQRWRSMFTTSDGQPISDEAVKRDSLEVSGLEVTMLELMGRYSDEMTAAALTEVDYTMLAAIVETTDGSDGPWFFKATGPVATMAANREAFLEMVRSLRR